MIKFEISEKDLKKINKTSMLFDSDQEIASLKVGDYYLSLMVRGNVRVEYKGQIYKYFTNMPKELQNIFENENYLENEDLNIIDNNWFEFDLLKKTEYGNYEYITSDCEIVTIEGGLGKNENQMENELYKLCMEELEELKEYWELNDLDLE